MRVRPATATSRPTSLDIGAYDPVARAVEKAASRTVDERALGSGTKTREDLARENGVFAFPGACIDLGAAARTWTEPPQKRPRRPRSRKVRAAQANRYESSLTFLAVADGRPIRRPRAASQTKNTRLRRRIQEKR